MQDHATWIASNELRRLAGRYVQRYGETVADVREAGPLAAYALVETGRRFRLPAQKLDNLWAYLTKVIKNECLKLLTFELRAAAPGAYAHWRFAKRAADRLKRESDLSEQEIWTRALRAADEAAPSALSTREVARPGEPEAHEMFGALDPGLAEVEMNATLRSLDALVRSELDDRDQRTWACLVAADFEPKRINPLDLGVTRTGVYWRVDRLLKELRVRADL